MHHTALLAAVALLHALAPAGAGGAEAGTLVLDESAYCRAHIEFGIDRIDAALLKSMGEKLLGARGLRGLKAQVRRRWGHLGRKWDEKAWMDEALVNFVGLQYGDRSHADTLIRVPPPGRGWTGVDFDDSSWLRQRLPLMVGKTGPSNRESSLGRRRGCFRFAFRVPDPGRAGGLSLSLTYRGGVRVFCNGREIARGHLPKGTLDENTLAAPYPLAAYCHLNEDGTPRKRTDRRNKGRISFVGDFYGRFDDAPPHTDRRGRPIEALRRTTGWRKHFVLNRPQWERIQGLRDRALGPVAIPKGLLRKGQNVLAVEVRTAALHPVAAGWTSFVLATNEAWDHGLLIRMALRAPGGSLPSAMKRPGGVQVWAEDMHRRIVSSEYGDGGAGSGTVRLAGACNGTFSGQVVVSTDRPLRGVTAVCSDLKSGSGAVIAGGRIRARSMPPHPLSHMIRLGQGRGGGDIGRNVLIGPVTLALRRHAPDGAGSRRLPRAERARLAGEISFFDHISEEPLPSVPANSCRPLWLTLRVPPDAAPGTYKGALKVSGEGMDPVHVPVEARVFGWRVPAGDFQTVVGMEQYPHSVAEQYGVPLWSEEHFRLMEASFRQMGRAGNDWLFIPVINFTEFGNLADSMVPAVLAEDGKLRFDTRIVDRYLDLAVRHLGRPRVICFVVMMGARGNPSQMQLLHAATGRLGRLDLTPASGVYRPAWKQLAGTIYRFMKSKGLGRCLYWGYAWDDEADPSLPALLGQVTPGVEWASGTHGHAAGTHYTAKSFIYKVANLQVRSAMGWKRPDILLINPRPGGNIIGLNGHTNPLSFRIISCRAIVSGVSGPGRLGADDFANVFFRGVRSAGFLRPGMPVSAMLWPGTRGAEPSARFEALIEGLQEAEARIFLEQAIDRKLLPPALAAKAREVLFEHNRGTFYISSLSDHPLYSEHTYDWRERSGRLFETAAEAGAVVGLDVDKTAVKISAPARGKRTAPLRLRNWTGKARAWRARADQPWILPRREAGTLSGVEELEVTLDAAAIKPRTTAKGTLTVTDVASGREYPVAIAASVGEVLAFVPPEGDTARVFWGFQFIPHKGRIPFNVSAGGSETREVMVHNRSGAEVSYKVSASAGWIQVQPASGKAPPESPITLKVTAAPPERQPAYHEAALTVEEVGGAAKVKVPLAVHVIRPYRAPALPPVRAVPVTGEVYAALLKRYGGARGAISVGAQPIGDDMKRKYWPRARPFARCVRGGAPYEAVFNLEGKGFQAFSAYVGFPDTWNILVGMWGLPGAATDRLNYEIYVDGKLRAQSGLMAPTDDFRLLAVDALAGAKEMRLVVRPLKLPSYPLNVFWFDPAFHK